VDRAHLNSAVCRAVLACTLVTTCLPGAPAVGQITTVRAPVFAFDARALVGAGRIMARTRFRRRGTSTAARELASIAAHGDRRVRPRYERFFSAKVRAFLNGASQLGVRTDDAGEARALFIQVALKIYDGQSFGDAMPRLHGAGLWGEGALTGMAAASASLAKLQFVLEVKYVTGKSPRFAALRDAGKQRAYDVYALATQLLAEAAQAAALRADRKAQASVRAQAERQLRADLGVDPHRVRFTAAGLDLR
jgi:uncharacterized protein DUF6683